VAKRLIRNIRYGRIFPMQGESNTIRHICKERRLNNRDLIANPALGESISGAPVDDEARKRNQNLPGMGGVYNTVNLHLYHYAGNNPVKYTDPDGREDERIQQAIDILANTNWAKTEEGKKVVNILNELNDAGRITMLDTSREVNEGKAGGGYDRKTDEITITNQRYRELTVASLVHEGVHALDNREGRMGYDAESNTYWGYDFDKERHAFDVGDAIKSELFGFDYPPTTDEFIHYWYDDSFDQ
jgi:hypothetical protein